MTAMDPKPLFIAAVRAAEHLPAALRDHAIDVIGLDERTFNETYLEFLDEQIKLGARGPEWTERLRKRRAALAAYCNVPLLDGRVNVGRLDFWVKVDALTRIVVHWEEYVYDRSG
jgi:hypothetical protein